MDRREFLMHIGALLLAVIGVASLLKTLSDPHPLKKSIGFGSGSYGGKKGSLK